MGSILTAQLQVLTDHSPSEAATTQVWDPDAGCTLVVACPQEEPELWSEYVRGAVRSYRRHGVEVALDRVALRTAADTALFFAVIDASGRVAGGVRAKGPLRSAEESHAVTEWAGQPGLSTVRTMITNRLPFGVLEMKTAWVDGDRERSRSLSVVLARTGFHAMTRLNVQFCMATAGDHVLNSWLSSGGVVADQIPPTPYPDSRYRTKMMWWDRRTLTKYAQRQQVSKMLREAIVLARPSQDVVEPPLCYRNGE
jgi:hypothetical protein